MRNPRKVYDRLFGTQSGSRFRNITDLALENARDLRQRLSVADRLKFEEYFEAVRTIETRMDRIDAMKAGLVTAKIERPEEYLPRNEYIQLMGDLLVTALQTGITNVGTLMVGPERWTTPTNWEGILDKPHSHHAMTHNPREHLEDLLKLDYFHVSVFARLIERMDGIQEAGGTTLLDNTIFTLGGNGRRHNASVQRSAADRCRRWRRNSEARPAYPLQHRHTAGQPVAHPAAVPRYRPRNVRRQHRDNPRNPGLISGSSQTVKDAANL